MKRSYSIAIVTVVLVGILYIVAHHSQPQSQGFDVRDAFTAGICNNDAVLTSDETTVVLHGGEDEVIILPKQSPVYLCGEEEGHITVVFPKNGSPADCSNRKANTCMSGTVPIPFETITLG